MYSLALSLFNKTYGDDGQITRKIAHTGFVLFAVLLLQTSFQKFIFQCPETNYVRFSYLCFFVPPFPLLLSGWLSNGDFQNAIRGLCYGCGNREKRKRAQLRIRWRSLIKTMLTSHVSAYVAPFSWFLMSLLNRKIMTCAVFGPPSLNISLAAKRDYRNLETRSQLIGFLMLVVGTTVMAIILTIKQCCSKAKTSQKIDEFECLNNYVSYEAEAARKYFEESMKAAAEENGRRKVKMLLDARTPSLDDLDNVEKAMKEMSYGHFSSVRNSLMQIYPKTNASDCNLQTYTIDAWEEEAQVFQQHLQNGGNFEEKRPKENGDVISGIILPVNVNDEKIQLLSMDSNHQNYSS